MIAEINCRNDVSDGADWTSTGRPFQSRGRAAANERSPTVTRSRDGQADRNIGLPINTLTMRVWPTTFWTFRDIWLRFMWRLFQYSRSRSRSRARRRPSTACSTSLPAQHLRPSGLFSCRPTVWNSLPHFIRDPTISADYFRRLLKT